MSNPNITEFAGSDPNKCRRCRAGFKPLSLEDVKCNHCIGFNARLYKLNRGATNAKN